MARHNIPLRDKAKVKARLSRGLSFNKAKEGTSIRSIGTIFNIKNKELKEIEELRREYISMIRGFGGDEETKARVMAEKLHATKLYGKDAIEHPDWNAKQEAVEYIDKLTGMLPEEKSGLAINIFNNPDFIKSYDERK